MDAGLGVRLTLLDHPSGDRVAVAQTRSGDWIYAAVPGYEPRASGESSDHALARLRAAVERSTDEGSIVEFVQRREGKARQGDLSLERMREHLREFCATQRAVGFDGAGLSSASASARDERAIQQSERSQADTDKQAGPGPSPNANPELSRRRDGWTPPSSVPNESEFETRLERWGRAQAAIDQGKKGAHALQDPQQARAVGHADRAPTSSAPPMHPSRDVGHNGNAALGKCRVDWRPAPADLEALHRALRNRSPDRGR